ncbi:MAG: Arc family DNA-binding protein [Desulfovibrionales bacterium]|nr:MAG: Arc family DNA-binding protein [Desulfovibrionales bacterium]
MTTITVKNIPDDVYQRLKVAAQSNRRSINSEVIWRIRQSLGGRAASPETILAEAGELRRLTENHPISDKTFNQAKQEGRP